jgi:small redox-active disulfide protein 2
MLIQVLGPGCSKCAALYERTRQAAQNLGVDATIEKIDDINQITAFGVMMTPALVVNGEVKMSGKLPSVEQIEAILLSVS